MGPFFHSPAYFVFRSKTEKELGEGRSEEEKKKKEERRIIHKTLLTILLGVAKA